MCTEQCIWNVSNVLSYTHNTVVASGIYDFTTLRLLMAGAGVGNPS